MVLILFIIHIEYKQLLKFLKFSQSLFELDLLFFLINAIKEIITNEDNKKELSKLYSEIQTLQKRLSNLIDLKLDNIENKDFYNEKEKEEQPMEIFDDVKFENLVEKIIIGEKDRNGNINPNTIRFVLKIGTEYKFKDLSFVPNKKADLFNEK